jgi:hypothetical protein
MHFESLRVVFENSFGVVIVTPFATIRVVSLKNHWPLACTVFPYGAELFKMDSRWELSKYPFRHRRVYSFLGGAALF